MRERQSAETDVMAKVRDFMHDLTTLFEKMPDDEKRELGVIVTIQDQNLDDEDKLTSSIVVLGHMMNVASAFNNFEEEHPDILRVSKVIKMLKNG